MIGGGFAERWPEFALRNWNRPGADQYQQWDGIPTGAAIASEIPVLVGASGDQEITLPVELPRLTAKYYRLQFVSNDVRSVAFYNGLNYQLSKEDPTDNGIGKTIVAAPLTAEQQRGANVQALVKIAGKDWEVQDWTNEPIKTFCRDTKAERVEEIIIIFSNSAFEDKDRILEPQGLEPTLWVSNLGCWRWTGTTTSTTHWDKAFLFTDVDDTANATVVWTAQPRQLQTDPYGRYYLAATTFTPTGNVQWSYSANGNSGFCQTKGGSSQTISSEDGYRQVYAFVVSGATYRGYGGSGTTVAPQSLTWTCSDGSTIGPDDHDVTWFSPGDAIRWKQVKANGATIDDSFSLDLTGELTQGNTKGSWKLTAQTEP